MVQRIYELMVNVDNLNKVNDYLTYISTDKNIEIKNYLYRLDPYKYLKRVKNYSLKDKEEVTGKLLIISIDPDDESTGYCLMEVKDELYNIIIYDPKDTFKEWDANKGIILHEIVGILRMDKKGLPKFHLRYFNEEFDEDNVKFTKYIFDNIDMIASYSDDDGNYPPPPVNPDFSLR